jgi:hypothetical protein
LNPISQSVQPYTHLEISHVFPDLLFLLSPLHPDEQASPFDSGLYSLDMASAATTATEMVAPDDRPPSPHLGDFSHVFATFLKLQSENEPKIELKIHSNAKPGTEKQLVGGHGSETTPRIPSRRVKIASPTKPHDALLMAYGVELVSSTDSPSRNSDSTATSSSLGGLRYSSSLSTPPGSASTDKTGASFVSGRLDHMIPTIPSGRLSAVVEDLTYTATAHIHAHVVGSTAAKASSRKPAIAYSSNGCYVYSEFQKQPYKGITLFAVSGPERQDYITPSYMCSKEGKQALLQMKLDPILAADQELKVFSTVAANPVHIFVDLSNITIGFYDSLKARHGVPVTKRVRAPLFSFEQLACVLQRGRRVEKKVVAGSLVQTYTRKWPEFMQEAKDLGYEMNILQRVSKAAASPSRRYSRRGNSEVEWTTSGAESSADELFTGYLKQAEQGVDELLHLKMLQSALDSDPATIVLATGDAAEAEYSDGFKKNVERLLQNGWNVEIIGWAKGISSAWRDPQFQKIWGDRIRLIELDMFSEELFAAWFGARGY